MGHRENGASRWLLIPRALEYAYRVATAPLRTLPDFLIIGTQRGGTTSLYNYLVTSSLTLPSLRKEVHFFDKRFARGVLWYRTHFPSVLTRLSASQRTRRGRLVGEATPYYLFHPHAARRAAETIPGVKLIVLLRNPIDRALSHYHHEVRQGVETESFQDALDMEEQRLEGELDRMLSDECYISFNHQHFSYLSRGVYIEQIRRWLEWFPREQVLIVKSEQLFIRPDLVTREVAEFLGLVLREFVGTRRYNEAEYPEMDLNVRQRLAAYFGPHNEALQSYLGTLYDWT